MDNLSKLPPPAGFADRDPHAGAGTDSRQAGGTLELPLAELIEGVGLRAGEVRDMPGLLRRLQAARGRASQVTSGDPVLSIISGKPAINAAIIEAWDLRPLQVLTAQPHGPRRPVLPMSSPHILRAQQLAAHGGKMKTLWQSSACWDPYSRELAETQISFGTTQVRTLPEPFPRMIIMDRSVAFLPTQSLEDVLLDRSVGQMEAPGYHSSLVVRHPVIVGHLADAFEGLWARARPWDGSLPEGGVALEESEVVILRYLDQALTVEEIAVRLGTSTRTVKLRVNKIKEKFGVRSYYGLGQRWQAMQRSTDGASA